MAQFGHNFSPDSTIPPCTMQGYHGDLTEQEQETLRAVMLLRHQVRSCAWRHRC